MIGTINISPHDLCIGFNANNNAVLNWQGEGVSLVYRSHNGIDFYFLTRLDPGVNEFVDISANQGSSFYYRIEDINNRNKTNVVSMLNYYTFLPETESLVSRMTVAPSRDLKFLIENTIRRLKENDIWNGLDCFYINAIHDSQAASLNWIKNQHNLIITNSPYFNKFYGFTGDTVAVYINQQYKPYSDGINFKKDDASIFIGIGKKSTNGNYYLGASDSVNTKYTKVIQYIFTGNRYCSAFINSAGGYTGIDSGSPSQYGIDMSVFGYVRDGEYVQGYLEGVASGPNSNIASKDPPDYEIYQLAQNLNGSMDNPGPESIFFTLFGKKLSAIQINQLYGIMKDWWNNVKETYSYGEELTPFGTFDDPDVWSNKSATFNVVDGKGVYSDTGNNYIIKYGFSSIKQGKYYRIRFNISDTIGSAYVGFLTVGNYFFGGLLIVPPGNFDMIYMSSYDSSEIRVSGNVASYSSWKIDNLSIKELIN